MTDLGPYIRMRSVEEGDCLHWYTKAQSRERRKHPMFRLDNKTYLARRALYEAECGEIRSGYNLLPTCGNEFCIQPEHQKQITVRQAAVMGGRAGSQSLTRGPKVRATRVKKGYSLLTPDLAREVRAADGTCTELAKKYGVSIKAVSDCRLGKTWPEVNPFAGLA